MSSTLPQKAQAQGVFPAVCISHFVMSRGEKCRHTLHLAPYRPLVSEARPCFAMADLFLGSLSTACFFLAFQKDDWTCDLFWTLNCFDENGKAFGEGL